MTEQIEDERCKYMHGQQKLSVEQQFHLLLRMLRRDFPTKYPVKVRRVILSKTLRGVCSVANSDKPKDRRYFAILLCKSDPWATQRDTLIHEWAHALTWFQLGEGKDHGDLFARKYGVLYRALIED